MKKLHLIALLILWLSGRAHSEPGRLPTSPNDPFAHRGSFTPRPENYYNDLVSEQMKNRPSDSGSDIVNAAKVSVTHVPSLPPHYFKQNGNWESYLDRSYKLADAAGMSIEGANSAASSFAALAAIFPTLITPTTGTLGFDPVRLAAIGPVTAAMAEYKAQADQSYLSANHNGDGVVRLAYDPITGVQRQGIASIPNSAATGPKPKSALEHLDETTRDFFKNQGVDPEKFFERLLSGEINGKNPIAVLEALNIDQTLTGEDLERGQKIAELLLSGKTPFISEPKGSLEDKKTNTEKESQDATDKDKEDKSKAKDKERKKEDSTDSEIAFQGIALEGIYQSPQSVKTSKALNAKQKKGEGGYIQKITLSLFHQLLKVGVRVPLNKVSIFQIAHHQYRDFNKWRALTSLARKMR